MGYVSVIIRYVRRKDHGWRPSCFVYLAFKIETQWNFWTRFEGKTDG